MRSYFLPSFPPGQLLFQRQPVGVATDMAPARCPPATRSLSPGAYSNQGQGQSAPARGREAEIRPGRRPPVAPEPPALPRMRRDVFGGLAVHGGLAPEVGHQPCGSKKNPPAEGQAVGTPSAGWGSRRKRTADHHAEELKPDRHEEASVESRADATSDWRPSTAEARLSGDGPSWSPGSCGSSLTTITMAGDDGRLSAHAAEDWQQGCAHQDRALGESR